MKHLTKLTEQELLSINGGGFFEDFKNNLLGIISNGIKKNWDAMNDNIIATVATGLGFLGSLLGFK